MSFINQDGCHQSYHTAGLDPPVIEDVPAPPPAENNNPLPSPSNNNRSNDTSSHPSNNQSDSTILVPSTIIHSVPTAQGWSTASSDAEVQSQSSLSHHSNDTSQLLSYQTHDPHHGSASANPSIPSDPPASVNLQLSSRI